MTGENLVRLLCLMQLRVELGLERMGQLVESTMLIEQFESELGSPLLLQTLLTIFDREAPQVWSAETSARNRQFVQDAHAKHRQLHRFDPGREK